MRELAAGLNGITGAEVSITGDRDIGEVPLLLMRLQSGGRSAAPAHITRLAAGTPSVHADPTRIDEGIVIFNPVCLKDGEARVVAGCVLRLI